LLQARQKWTRACRNVKVDDVVIAKDKRLPRNQWRLAPVVDALVRKVKLLVADSSFNRSGKRCKPPVYLDRLVQKLVLLVPCDEL